MLSSNGSYPFSTKLGTFSQVEFCYFCVVHAKVYQGRLQEGCVCWRKRNQEPFIEGELSVAGVS